MALAHILYSVQFQYEIENFNKKNKSKECYVITRFYEQSVLNDTPSMC